MSIRTVNAVENGSVSPPSVPCQGGGSSQAFPQSGVRDTEVLLIKFGGNPPYNLTQTVCNNKGSNGGMCWCAPMSITRLDYSTFNWAVKSIPLNKPGNTTEILFTPESGHSIIWTAIQLNTSAVSQTPYYSSPNFSYSTTSYDNPKSGAAPNIPGTGKLGMAMWGIFGLAALGLMGV